MKEDNLLEQHLTNALLEHYESISDEEIAILEHIHEDDIVNIIEFAVDNGEVELTEEVFGEILSEEAQQLDEIVPVLFGLARAAQLGYRAYKGYKSLKKMNQLGNAVASVKKAGQAAKSGYKYASKAAAKNPGKYAGAYGKSALKGTANLAWKGTKGAAKMTKDLVNPMQFVGSKKAIKKAIGAHAKLGGASAISSTAQAAKDAYTGNTNRSIIPKGQTVGLINRKNKPDGSKPETPFPLDPTRIHRRAVFGKQGSQARQNKDALINPTDDTSYTDNIKPDTDKKRPKLKAPGIKTEAYEFQVDVNENIIGASFARGDNQGNFNNEVDAVRDALAQIQELSPSTISSYQKKAGKQYRQAKGEKPMNPEYTAGLNAAGKMSDKDMDDNDKTYDTMKKRGKGLAMSKGKGKMNEAPVGVPNKLAITNIRGGVKKQLDKKFQKPAQSLSAKPTKPYSGKSMFKGSKPKFQAKPIPGLKNQPGNLNKLEYQPKGRPVKEGAMKELDTKKQENERLAKKKKGSEYSDKEVRMGSGVAFDKRYKGGNMTGAYKTINKIKKGLGDHPKVADALRRANEQFNNEGE